jgi:hypothetical protein
VTSVRGDALRSGPVVEADLSSAWLEALVRVLQEPEHPYTRALVEAAGTQLVRPVLASAWMAEGRTVSPVLTAEVAAYRVRHDHYREVLADLRAAFPALLPIKGVEVASLYPDGWVRNGNDLDLIAPDPTTVWRAGAHARERGWTFGALMLQRLRGHVQVGLVLEREPTDPMVLWPEQIEIRSIGFAGSTWTVPSRPSWELQGFPSTVRHVLGLMEQRFERSMKARDVLDAAVVLRAAARSDLPPLFGALDRLGLWREWEGVVAVLRYLQVRGAEDLLPPDAGRRRAVATARRGARVAGRALRPRVGGYSMIERVEEFRQGGALIRRGATLARRLLTPAAALAAGLPVAGLMIDPEPAHQTMELGTVGEWPVARTAVGTVLLTLTEHVRPELVDRVRRGLAGTG